MSERINDAVLKEFDGNAESVSLHLELGEASRGAAPLQAIMSTNALSDLENSEGETRSSG
jgi:hypothetical protein